MDEGFSGQLTEVVYALVRQRNAMARLSFLSTKADTIQSQARFSEGEGRIPLSSRPP